MRADTNFQGQELCNYAAEIEKLLMHEFLSVKARQKREQEIDCYLLLITQTLQILDRRLALEIKYDA